jgi:HK97 family phage major capsid protein
MNEAEFATELTDLIMRRFETSRIDLKPKDARRYSFLRLIRHAAGLTGTDCDAGFEMELHQELAKRFSKQGRTFQGILVPQNVLTSRDLVAGTDTAGGFTVESSVKADSFIELLRNQMLVRAMGATVLDGLQGDVELPRQNAAAQGYWVGEGSGPSESDQTFGQVNLSPKTVGAYTDISRKLLIQSSLSVEMLIREDLAQVLGLAIDLAALRGTGTAGQPLGIVNTTGVGSVAIGANGGAPTMAVLLSMESKVAAANALRGKLGYLTNASIRGKLKGTEKSASGTTGNFIWTERADGFGDVNGYRAGMTNQVPSNLTKGTSNGTCSELYFGNWADLLIGEWGVLDLLVDPYTKGVSGGVRVRALQDVDIGLRHPESFCVCQDAIGN